MKLQEFSIGMRFWMQDQQYQCTDVGTRTVAAVKIDQTVEEDRSWLNGPPYALAEFSLDEYDIETCTLTNEGN